MPLDVSGIAGHPGGGSCKLRHRRDVMLRLGASHRGCTQGAPVAGCQHRCHPLLTFHARASPSWVLLPWIKGFHVKLPAGGGFASLARCGHPASARHLEPPPQRWDLFFLLSWCDSRLEEQRWVRACVVGDAAAMPCCAPRAHQPPLCFFFCFVFFYCLLGAVNSFATFSSAILSAPT